MLASPGCVIDAFSSPSGSGVDSSWTYDQGTQYNGSGCAANWGTGGNPPFVSLHWFNFPAR